jgi:hypothetical protein
VSHPRVGGGPEISGPDLRLVLQAIGRAAGSGKGRTRLWASGKGNDMIKSIAVGNLVCAMVCAKWALELGYSQTRQVLFLIAGLLFGPLTLLILYVYLVEKAQKEGRPGSKLI